MYLTTIKLFLIFLSALVLMGGSVVIYTATVIVPDELYKVLNIFNYIAGILLLILAYLLFTVEITKDDLA